MYRAGGTLDEVADEAARLICDEGYTDYRPARTKAAERLGLGSRGSLPEYAAIERAVLDRQALFGGVAYVERLRAMRRTALSAMKLLASFRPQLAGGAVSGAIGKAHRVQLHVFSEVPEAVEIFLGDRSIHCEQAERRYRLASGREESIPLCRFEAEGIGIDIAVFEREAGGWTPLSIIDGKPVRRLDARQVQELLDRPA